MNLAYFYPPSQAMPAHARDSGPSLGSTKYYEIREVMDLWSFWVKIKFLFFVGSVIGSHFHRQVLAALVYIVDTVALISAFIIVKLNPILAGVSVALIVIGFIFFGFLSYLGQRLMQNMVENGEEIELSGNQTVAKTARKTKGKENEAYVISDERIGDLDAAKTNVVGERNSSEA